MTSVTKSPTLASNNATIGSVAWTDVDNSKLLDSVYTTITLNDQEVSNYIKVSSFGFSIPTGATINGIKATIYCADDSGGTNTQISSVKIVKSDGSISTTNLATGNEYTPTDFSLYGVAPVDFGGATNKWGETWTYSDINNSNFGLVFSVYDQYAGDGDAVYVDYIALQVYYTESSITSPFPSFKQT